MPCCRLRSLLPSSRHLSVALPPSSRHRRRICRPPSRHHCYRGMSSHRHRRIPSCCRWIASCRHRIPSRRRRITSRHHQVSSSPPPPLSLRVLGAATVALLRMSRRRDALPRLTALPLRRRLKNYGSFYPLLLNHITGISLRKCFISVFFNCYVKKYSIVIFFCCCCCWFL
jgi:hypothetical protein